MSADLFEFENITNEEKDISSRQAFGKLLPFLKKHVRGLSLCLLMLATATILTIYWPILIRKAIDVNISNSDFRGLINTVILIGVLQLTSLVFQYLQRVKLETIGQNVMVDLKSRLYHHILSLDIAFFDRNPVGRLLARVESDTESLRLMFTNTAVLLVGDLLLITGIYSIMFYYHWRLALILISIIPVTGILVVIIARITSSRFLAVRKKMAEVTASLTEFLHGMSIIQIFHRGEYACRKVSRANELKFKEHSYAEIAFIVFFNTIFFFQYVAIALTLFFGVIWLKSGVLTVGTISMFIILIWRSFDPIWRVSEQLSTIQKSIAGAKRIFALLSQKSSLPQPEKPVAWNGLKKSIKFENVTFSYTGNDTYALKDVSFEIPAGKRVALVGATGGGKTTVISLLLRLYDPQQGRITVDDIDIRNIATDELRKRFALVLQDIILFPGDVRSNISLDTEQISDDLVIRAAQTVEADRFIHRLPKGYQTEVSEKGMNFSRGERQLLSFARALASDPDVLLLDEATSSVDPETERVIQNSLKKLMAERTSIIVAHRLSTILDVDEILVIRHGEIIERGTHTELILKEDGYYAKLFHLQFKNRNGVLNNVK
ncbi:MAG: ABC transporter ATP-binding protein [Candidatus Zixiibacteriota bacterium]